jgi:hypothetical protein
MGWATIWVNFSQSRLVALPAVRRTVMPRCRTSWPVGRRGFTALSIATQRSVKMWAGPTKPWPFYSARRLVNEKNAFTRSARCVESTPRLLFFSTVFFLEKKLSQLKKSRFIKCKFWRRQLIDKFLQLIHSS